MDVFRAGRGGRVLPLTEENYRLETNRMPPFVQMRGGHPSYFAVCPACGNPILICNLFKRNRGSDRQGPTDVTIPHPFPVSRTMTEPPTCSVRCPGTIRIPVTRAGLRRIRPDGNCTL